MSPEAGAKGEKRRGRGRKWFFRAVLIAVSLVAAVLCAEVALRVAYPSAEFVHGTEWAHWRDNSELFKKAYVADAELGFRPRVDSQWYDEFGTLKAGRSYPKQKGAGVRRVLFIGDSVTQRATIPTACKERFEEPGTEYWNAGVEAFNTVQEVAWYRRYNHGIEPDHVVLTLHHNDFAVTPVAFYDDEDRLRVYEPDGPSHGLNPWLFRNSYVYRLVFEWVVRGRGEQDFERSATDVERALGELRALLEASNVRFTVLVLPLLLPPADWPKHERTIHERALAMLGKLGIDHYDLEPPMVEALADKVAVQQLPGDTWHPSPEVAKYFVEHMAAAGFRP